MLTKLADGVVLYLNQQTFSPSFTAARTEFGFRQDENEQTRELIVTVEPVAETRQIISTAATDRQYGIGVTITKAVADSAEMDEMIDLAEAIKDSIEQVSFEIDGVDATWLRTEHAPLYDQEIANQSGRFDSTPVFLFQSGVCSNG